MAASPYDHVPIGPNEDVTAAAVVVTRRDDEQPRVGPDDLELLRLELHDERAALVGAATREVELAGRVQQLTGWRVTHATYARGNELRPHHRPQ